MFTQQELDSIDKKYFAVIIADQYDVTLMSIHNLDSLHCFMDIEVVFCYAYVLPF